jgi:roadblock/LC7 domain-containing protein
VVERSVDELLEIRGVVAAGKFTHAGTAIEFKSAVDLLPPLRDLAMRLSAKVSETFDQLATSYSSMSQMEWTPRRFWTYSGGDWTVAVGGDRLVFARTSDIDLNALFKAVAVENGT